MEPDFRAFLHYMIIWEDGSPKPLLDAQRFSGCVQVTMTFDSKLTATSSGVLLSNDLVATSYHQIADAWRHGQVTKITEIRVRFFDNATAEGELIEEEEEYRDQALSKAYNIIPALFKLGGGEQHPEKVEIGFETGDYAELTVSNPETVQVVTDTTVYHCQEVGDLFVFKLKTLADKKYDRATLSIVKNQGVNVTCVGYPRVEATTEREKRRLILTYARKIQGLPVDKESKATKICTIVQGYCRGNNGTQKCGEGRANFGNGNTFVFTNASTEMEMSGGPVFDGNNNVVGFISGGWMHENRNFLLPVAHPFVQAYLGKFGFTAS